MLAAIRGADIFKNAPISNPALASQDEALEEPDFQHCPRTRAVIAAFGDELTFGAVLHLTVKLVEPVSTEKAKTVLLWFASNFSNLRERMRAPPERAKLRRRLQAMADRGRQDLAELEDFEIISRLVDAERADRGSCNAADVERRRRTLKDHARFATIAAEKIPTGKGDKRAEGDISPEELAAFMVGRAWQVGRGEWPNSQNKEAWKACESLWIAAGGEASGAKRSPEKWRRHLEHASRPRPQGADGAAFIRDGAGRIVMVEVRTRSRTCTTLASAR
ncbi:MAG TPA: hypothetical protein VGL12_06380 [Roseiarcus sp.]|jgi:hypothetical protein